MMQFADFSKGIFFIKPTRLIFFTNTLKNLWTWFTMD